MSVATRRFVTLFLAEDEDEVFYKAVAIIFIVFPLLNTPVK